jgi:hypothetical protein
VTTRKDLKQERNLPPVPPSPVSTELLIEAEIGRRATEQTRLKPILVPQKVVDAKIPLLNQGTIVTIVSTRSQEYLDGLAAAVKAGNAAEARVFGDAVTGLTRREYLTKRKRLDVTTAPFIVDVMYGSAWLAQHMVLADDTSIALSSATWSGGKLDEDKFALVLHTLRKAAKSGLHVLTLLVPPSLSKVEQALVRAVPAGLGEIHVKGPSVAWTAAGISAKWDAPARGDALAYVPSSRVLDPFYEKHQQYTTMDQQQVQQQDTRQQQQKQQFQDTHTQQQQQQIQQQDKQQQVQQQNQLNQEQAQQQQQQLQNDNGQQEQHQNQDRHANDCAMQHESSMFWDDLDGGLVFRQFEEEIYRSAIERIDFEALDATQSVKELVRLRERLLTIGMP